MSDETWIERIRCPKCGRVQNATCVLYDGYPFPSYVHECDRCCYLIVESEWDIVDETTTASSAKEHA